MVLLFINSLFRCYFDRKKATIESKYNEMHEICAKPERYRERITHSSNPYAEKGFVYYPQPENTPMQWYDMHNLETIVQQLFTPKLRTRTHFDENARQLRVHRGFQKESERKRFLPLPSRYYNSDGLADTTIANNVSAIETGINVHGNQASTIEHFNKNILEQYTWVSSILWDLWL